MDKFVLVLPSINIVVGVFAIVYFGIHFIVDLIIIEKWTVVQQIKL